MNLREYFTNGIGLYELGETIGAEIETQFLDGNGDPITTATSQLILQALVSRGNWKIDKMKGALIAEIVSSDGDKILYELGRHNIELSMRPLPRDRVVADTREKLDELYIAAAERRAEPFFEPVIDTCEDLLVIPDERDATWLELDGRRTLNLLARCSAVQFTIDVPATEAIRCLNALGSAIKEFLADYPQDVLWRKYIRDSAAGYDPLRYGGPLQFRNLDDYCEKLLRHKVVSGNRLVPFDLVPSADIPLFLRSIWWYFRLKRYGPKLCIEVRPIARNEDNDITEKLDMVMEIIA